jgi:hypothetical protein
MIWQKHSSKIWKTEHTRGTLCDCLSIPFELWNGIAEDALDCLTFAREF